MQYTVEERGPTPIMIFESAEQLFVRLVKGTIYSIAVHSLISKTLVARTESINFPVVFVAGIAGARDRCRDLC